MLFSECARSTFRLNNNLDVAFVGLLGTIQPKRLRISVLAAVSQQVCEQKKKNTSVLIYLLKDAADSIL